MEESKASRSVIFSGKDVLAFLFLEQTGVLEDGLTGGCFGNAWVLGSYASKASSYHFHVGQSGL